MNSWHSYGSIYNFGHSAVANLLMEPVLVEEKVDGSQFSFGRFGDTIRVKSKGKEFPIDAPEKMFSLAVETVKSLDLRDGWTYRAEYLQKPKHNVLAYSRIPEKHLILFDIAIGEEQYIQSWEEKADEAKRLGLEIVPKIHYGMVDSMEVFKSLLNRISILGGQKIEGVVIKNYNRFGPDKKILMGKYVSEEFKEIHQGEWRKNNPTRGDVIQELILNYKTPARYNKAIQHLREAGLLENDPKDIGKLIKEVQADIKKECKEEIMEKLYKYAWPQIERAVVGGLPQYYKDLLVKQQFENLEDASK
jgi:hypothetical protein